MAADRIFRVLWGPNLENALDFNYPVVGENAMVWRQPRTGSRREQTGASYLAWLNGRHYRLKVSARYFGGQQWFGVGYGLQSFMDWAADSNPFTLVPNVFAPTLTVPGCYLEGPFVTPSITVEGSEDQAVDLTILHPTQDLGLAWRGLWLEWAAGADLAKPGAYPGVFFGRTLNNTPNSFETGPDGRLRTVAANVIRDGNWWLGGGGTWTAAGGNVAGPPPSGIQTALVEQPRSNLVLQSVAMTVSPWRADDGNATDTATANAYVAPDGTVTATRVVEGTDLSVHGWQQTVAATFTAGHSIAVSAWWRPGQRTKGELIYSSQQNGNYIGVDFDLNGDGTITLGNAGGSVVFAAWLGPFPGDWYYIWIVGQIDAASTTSGYLQLRMRNGAGSNNYTGDGASGCYWWGAQVEDLAFAPNANFGLYAPSSLIVTTTSVGMRQADSWFFPVNQVAPQPMWYYLKFVELGTVINNTAGDDCRLVSIGNGSPQATWIEASNGKYVADYLTGGVQIGSPNGALSSPRYGDTVELLVVLDTDYTIRMNQLIARIGTEEVGGKSTVGNAFPAAWSGGIITMNSQGAGSYGTMGLAQFKMGPLATSGPVVSNIFAARGS